MVTRLEVGPRVLAPTQPPDILHPGYSLPGVIQENTPKAEELFDPDTQVLHAEIAGINGMRKAMLPFQSGVNPENFNEFVAYMRVAKSLHTRMRAVTGLTLHARMGDIKPEQIENAKKALDPNNRSLPDSIDYLRGALTDRIVVDAEKLPQNAELPPYTNTFRPILSEEDLIKRIEDAAFINHDIATPFASMWGSMQVIQVGDASPENFDRINTKLADFTTQLFGSGEVLMKGEHLLEEMPLTFASSLVQAEVEKLNIKGLAVVLPQELADLKGKTKWSGYEIHRLVENVGQNWERKLQKYAGDVPPQAEVFARWNGEEVDYVFRDSMGNIEDPRLAARGEFEGQTTWGNGEGMRGVAKIIKLRIRDTGPNQVDVIASVPVLQMAA